MPAALRLRPLRRQDRDAALTAHDALARDDFTFLLDYVSGERWEVYLQRLSDQSRGLDPRAEMVPATFLAAIADGVLVGRISIRHTLNDYLAAYGGHIGYAVVPEHRSRGHAVDILRQGLIVARSLGVNSVLATCDDDNLASAHVLEKNGGVLEAKVRQPGTDVPLRRYWIH